MRLDCPRCGTTYRLSETRPLRAVATYECAKCHEVFGPGAAGDDDWRDEPGDDEFRFDDEAPASPRASRGRTGRVAEVERDEDEDTAADDDPTQSSAPAPRRSRRAARDEDDESDSQGVARFALRGLIAVTLLYAVLTVWASTHVERFQRLLGRIPLVGTRLAELPLDPGDVALRDVQGAYDYLKSGELAFVVRGTAVNLTAEPLRRVQVEGRVGGGEERRQLASCTDAPADVRKTSRQMLALMEDVREARPAIVPAGGSTACEVVFVDPPRPIAELSLEIVSVLAN
jgi:hypothetical protein